MSDEDERGYHLPTHLQQAEKVLDHHPATTPTREKGKTREPGIVQRVRKKLDTKARGPNEGSGPSFMHEQKVIDSLVKGRTYKVTYDNAITGARSELVGKYAKLDENRVLWFIDETRKVRRYLRPGAVVKVKEVKAR